MMNKKTAVCFALLAAGLFLTNAGRADDLKEYYEKQKAEIAPTFKAPELGSEITIKLAGGQARTGILMKLSATDISLLVDADMVEYKRGALHESSRAVFFAEDWAHVQALEKTREFSDQMRVENVAEEMANLHEGRITVNNKSSKSSDKEVEEDEKENEKTGNTVTTTTTTKTYTDIETLNITVGNNTTHPDTYTLEWYFFSKPLIDRNAQARGNREGAPAEEEVKISIHDSGSRRVTVEARSRKNESVTGEAYIVKKVTVDRVSSDSNNSHDPRVTETGKENAGWVVLLKYGNEILDKKASAKNYLDDEWIRKLRL